MLMLFFQSRWPLIFQEFESLGVVYFRFPKLSSCICFSMKYPSSFLIYVGSNLCSFVYIQYVNLIFL